MVFVVGVVGTIASGKDTLADLVAVGLGGKRFGFSQVIDEELARKGREVTRPNQRDLANSVRRREGPGAWAKILADRVAIQEGYAVAEGFRNPMEIKEFYADFGKKFVLVAIDAKLSIRFKRATERAKEGEKKTLQEFKDIDAREKGKGEEFYGHNIDGCMALADYAVINNGSFEDLKRQAGLVVEKVKRL